MKKQEIEEVIKIEACKDIDLNKIYTQEFIELRSKLKAVKMLLLVLQGEDKKAICKQYGFPLERLRQLEEKGLKIIMQYKE